MLRDVIIESLIVVTINFNFLLRHTVRNSNSTMQYLDDDFHISHSSGDSKKFKRGILGKKEKEKTSRSNSRFVQKSPIPKNPPRTNSQFIDSRTRFVCISPRKLRDANYRTALVTAERGASNGARQLARWIPRRSWPEHDTATGTGGGRALEKKEEVEEEEGKAKARPS